MSKKVVNSNKKTDLDISEQSVSVSQKSAKKMQKSKKAKQTSAQKSGHVRSGSAVLQKHETLVNLWIKIVAVLMTIMLMALMICNAPVISYTDTSNLNQISQISILKYFKMQKPMQYIEGTINRMSNSQLNIREDVDVNFNDGLDLKQTIEGQFTVLFLGFDSTENGSGYLHDVNYLIQFNLMTASMNILQIPRDTYMPGYTTSPTNKFNSIYTFGNASKSSIQRVVDCIQESFGVPIDAYVTTTCENVAEIIDIIGGVPIDMPYPIVFEADKVIPNGEQVLSGEQAEWFLRFRYGYQEGDVGRVQAQRIFMAAAMKKAISMNSIQMYSAINKIYKQELIATDLSMEDVSKLADLASTIEMENVNVFMLPGEFADVDGQSIWSIHKSAALDVLNTNFRTQQVALTVDNNPIVEYIEEGNYSYTTYDDMSANLQDIDENGGADPILNDSYKNNYDADYDERQSQNQAESAEE